MIRYFTFILLLTCIFGNAVRAQTITQNSGWLFLLSSHKFNEKWGSHLDVQLRSADEWGYLRNFMFRPGVTYFINDKNDLTLGYLLNTTHTQPEASDSYTLVEHRIWEQYIFKHKTIGVSASHRFRLEQRFIERYSNSNLFSQRFRYFFRFIIPLQQQSAAFERGPFAAIQNEVFLNLQHKEELNNHVFDQNRAYGAFGYRFHKKLDAELGYMNQLSKGRQGNTLNNIIQLALYSRF